MTPAQSTLAPVDRDVSAIRGRLTWTLPQQTRTALFAEYEQDVRDPRTVAQAASTSFESRAPVRASMSGSPEEGAYATNLGTTQQYTVGRCIDADYLRNTRMFSEYRARDAYSGRDEARRSGCATAGARAGAHRQHELRTGLAAPRRDTKRCTRHHRAGSSDQAGALEEHRAPRVPQRRHRRQHARPVWLRPKAHARLDLPHRTLWDVADVQNNQTRGWSQLGCVA